MAKYTELFAEYLESGGELPVAFKDIDGFEDLFVAHYCDKEIGFETEDLFKIKLEERAEIVIPIYVKLIESYEEAFSTINDPTKKHTRTFDIGSQNSKTTQLPMNAITASPSQTVDISGYTNTEEAVEEGFTPDEALKRLEYLGRIKSEELSIKYRCLEEFSSLFMKVY